MSSWDVIFIKLRLKIAYIHRPRIKVNCTTVCMRGDGVSPLSNIQYENESSSTLIDGARLVHHHGNQMEDQTGDLIWMILIDYCVLIESYPNSRTVLKGVIIGQNGR